MVRLYSGSSVTYQSETPFFFPDEVTSKVYELEPYGLSSDSPVLALPSGALVLTTTGGTQYGQIIALTKPSTKGAQWTRTNIYTFS